MTKNYYSTFKTISFIVFFLFFSSVAKVYAQHYAPLVHAGDSISKGITLYDSSHYEEALHVYQHISRNDTAYAASLVEKAITYIQLKEYIKACDVCREGLKLHSNFDFDFYDDLGSALDDTAKTDEAIKVYEAAALRFPNRYLLQFNLGIALEHAKRFDDAINAYERDIRLNMYHASSHLRLGMLELREGNIVQAMLSLQMFLLIEPLDDRSKGVVLLIEKIAQDTYKEDPKDVLKNDHEDPNFSNLAMIIKSKVALNSNYKATVKLNFDLVKQMQVLEEKLEYIPSDQNFWMQTYVPLFNDIYKKDYFAPFVYAELASVADDDINKWVKKNKGKITDMYQWVNSYIKKYKETCPVMLDGKLVTRHCWYYDNGDIQLVGDQNAQGKLSGMVIAYTKYGDISASGLLDDQGNKQGTWKWYYDNGALEQVSELKDDKKNGETTAYLSNGVLNKDENFAMDSLDGPYKEYYNSGELSVELTYKNGKKDGSGVFYYDKGVKHFDSNYKDGKLDGTLKEYFLKGQVKSTEEYVDGKQEGKYVQYYSNGKIAIEGVNKNGLSTGDWKYYFDDGSLKQEGSFDEKGKYSGEWKIYFKDGKLNEINNHNDKGELNDSDNIFNEQGVMTSSIIYKNGKMESFVFYGNDGKIISSDKAKRGQLHLHAFSPNGNQATVGDFIDGQREGIWTYYDNYGNISNVENYKSGKLDGIVINYLNNGDTDNVINYKDGTKNGYYRGYYHTKTLQKEGWYMSDLAQGDWYFYNVKQVLTAHNYYLNDNSYGWQYNYDDLGKVNEQDDYQLGLLQQVVYYDSTGAITDTFKLKNGNGNFIEKFKDGKERYILGYKDGYLNGSYTVKNEEGFTATKGNYFYGDQDGEWQWNYANGKPNVIKHFNLGNAEGKSIVYNNDGAIKIEGNYKDGNETGKWRFFDEDGKIDLISNYVDGNLDGQIYYYGGDSVLCGRRTYKKGVLVAYSYLGKDGKYIPDVNVKNASIHMVMYYSNGQKSFDANFVNNLLEGERLSYYPNGKLKENGNYKNDNEYGEAKSFYSNGVMRSNENYFDDDKDGKCVYYYNTGKVRISGTFVLNDRNGEWKYYDRNGKLVKTEIYYLGELYGVKKS